MYKIRNYGKDQEGPTAGGPTHAMNQPRFRNGEDGSNRSEIAT